MAKDNIEKYTVPTPIKDAASTRKYFFSPAQYGAFSQNFISIFFTQLHKIEENTLAIFSIFQGVAFIQ